MELDHFRTLGRSGLRVSPLCLGTMTFGKDWGWGVDSASSRELLFHYLDSGGNFIDTANVYTKGHSEVIIGEALQESGRRESVVLASKYGISTHAHDPNAGGSHRLSLKRAVHASLRRLQTDRIDLYWVHLYDPHTPLEETMRALDDLVRSGEICYVGFSDTPAWACARAQTLAEWRDYAPLAGLQIKYNLLERSPEAELLPMAAALGFGVTAWGPLDSGVLSGKYDRDNLDSARPQRGDGLKQKFNENVFALLDRMREIAEAHEASVAQVALAWLQAQPQMTAPIIGASDVQQLRDNLASLRLTLSPDELAGLQAATTVPDVFPSGFLQRARPALYNGCSINGIEAALFPLTPQSDSERW